MKKILLAFKRIWLKIFPKKIYLCDPERSGKCDKFACWYIRKGPCKCTQVKSRAKRGPDGKPIIASDADKYNEEYLDYCILHPEHNWRMSE